MGRRRNGGGCDCGGVQKSSEVSPVWSFSIAASSGELPAVMLGSVV
jgi:hypothetical protein